MLSEPEDLHNTHWINTLFWLQKTGQMPIRYWADGFPRCGVNANRSHSVILEKLIFGMFMSIGPGNGSNSPIRRKVATMQQEGSSDHLEIEVKFQVESRSGMADRILRAGGVPVSDVFETNIRWDDTSGSLTAKKCLLRLRTESGGRAILTFKSPPASNDDSRYKVFTERELAVSDPAEMGAILEALGFHPIQVYEKKRTTYRFDAVTLCLDRLPFGDFLEIEGGKDAIRQAAERLGFDWERRILDNYLTLFEKVRRSMGLTFSDVTFTNFEGIQVNGTIFDP